MSFESLERRDQILETAIKRFSYFGIGKTTMTELADDLALSKQALSYYFSDKMSLVKAVEVKIIDNFLAEVAEAFNHAEVKTALLEFTRIRIKYFEKYYMLAKQAYHAEFVNNNSAIDWRTAIREKEIQLLEPILKKGISIGQLKDIDVEKTAGLLVDMLYAFTRCVNDKTAFPSGEDFKELFSRVEETTRIFYEGIKSQEWQN